MYTKTSFLTEIKGCPNDAAVLCDILGGWYVPLSVVDPVNDRISEKTKAVMFYDSHGDRQLRVGDVRKALTLAPLNVDILLRGLDGFEFVDFVDVVRYRQRDVLVLSSAGHLSEVYYG